MSTFLLRSSRVIALAALLINALPVIAPAQTRWNPADSRSLDRYIVQLMDSAHVPGLSLALIDRNQIVYSQGYGLTKADSTQRVTAETVFDAASLSKPVFAYAVLQLVEEKVLDLDKPLYHYLPYPDVADDERYKLITARMVLSHRSGFPNWRKNRRSRQLPMIGTPGERFGYSGEGFVYLQKVVEKITGKPVNELLTERVFRPLGMTRSSYVWRNDFDSDFAQPHGESGEPEAKWKPVGANMAYSLQTTAPDYARFVLAILNAQGLQPATVRQMLSRQSRLPQRFLGSDTLSTSLYWGLGFGLETTATGDYFWHWGDNDSFKCFVMASPAQQKAVVYFTNSGNGLSFITDILKHCIGGEHVVAAFLGYKSYRNETK
ncbi:CubicO group peptidase (beta-lactamase class C family) [Larkinella arboricola]|uniref:CubicO group peptidase (Beta-lactamase class C family) n=1 Tax=Larkinella arboricola TaxID=643671 RepID=A0A327WTX4_LARAB|nr:serine hydrolase domain-containing protein [Larkinella arboricola]RAJ95860.1 CubicO group peptidase (beta-lactamase class C family) [Larkinella arboricola]